MRRPPPATTTGTWFVDGRRYIVSLWGRVTVGPQPALKCRGKLRFGSQIEPVGGHGLNNEEKAGILLAICLN